MFWISVNTCRFIYDQYADEDGNLQLEEEIALGFTFSYPCMYVNVFGSSTQHHFHLRLITQVTHRALLCI